MCYWQSYGFASYLERCILQKQKQLQNLWLNDKLNIWKSFLKSKCSYFLKGLFKKTTHDFIFCKYFIYKVIKHKAGSSQRLLSRGSKDSNSTLLDCSHWSWSLSCLHSSPPAEGSPWSGAPAHSGRSGRRTSPISCSRKGGAGVHGGLLQQWTKQWPSHLLIN